MPNPNYLFAANAAVLMGIAGYVFFLAVKSARLEKRIKQMEMLGDAQED